MENGYLLVASCLVFLLDWSCSSCQHLASAYRLERTDNISVLSDRKGDAMGPFAPYRETRRHQWSHSNLFQENGARIRRDAKSRTVDDNNNDMLLVQTLNGLVRGTRKTALGESVDVFLGVRRLEFP